MSTKSTNIRNSISLILLTVLFSGISGFDHACADDETENKKVVESKSLAERPQKNSAQASRPLAQKQTSTTTHNKSTANK